MKSYIYLLFKKYKFFVIVGLLLLTTYITISLIFFNSDPVISFFTFLGESYLLLFEKFANLLLGWSGSSVVIKDHIVMLNNVQIDGFFPEIRFKKWMILFLFLVWITKTSARKKILFSSLLIAVHFLVVSIYLAVGAHLASKEFQDYSLLSIPGTIALLGIITVFFIWYSKNKTVLMTSLSEFKVNTKFFENERRVILMIYVYVIAAGFLFEFFDYQLWINFLFTSAQKILVLFGEDAFVEPFQLVGANGSIFMSKGCLGFQTMLLFAILVFLTGDNNKLRWIYIISGVLILNLVNIMRFVFLFIYIQNHGANMLAMDVHDMYNVITYIVVFILWVIWFEKFGNRKQNITLAEKPQSL